MFSTRSLVSLFLLFLVAGCGLSHDNFVATPGSNQGPTTADIRVQQVLARAVPSAVTQQRFTGFDSQGETRFGPVLRDKAATVEMTGVPVAVTLLQIEYLQGNTVVGLGGISNSTSLTVSEATITSIAVTPGAPAVAKGTTQQFTATATLTDGTIQPVTDTATWSSGDEGVATIDEDGLATTEEPGQSVVTATVGSVSGSATLTVTNATVTSLQVTPGNDTIAKGTTRRFTAIATFSDTSTQNVTSGATWTSSNESAATIVPGGLATAVTPGTFTTITVDPSGRFVYAANQVSNNISAFTIDPLTGAFTPAGSSAAGASPPR